MKIGYARVSTLDQNLDRQIDQLKEQGVDECNIYQEKITGTKRSREQLDKMLNAIRPEDVIIVSDLTRISRSTNYTMRKYVVETKWKSAIISELYKSRNYNIVDIV
ncbi:MAG: recombinase family protein [Butyrivibrio sp.]|nr:recombinase family protein [Butyrivibrio sp.]